MKFFTEDEIKSMISDSKDLDALKAKLEDSEGYSADVLDLVEGEVVVVSFPPDYNEAAVKLTKLLQTTYPANPVVAVVNDIELLIQYPDEALKMLDDMKDKICSMTGITDIRNKILDVN